MATIKKFDACVPRPRSDEGTWWHRIGNAIENDKGQVHIYLDSLPVPDKDGVLKIVLFEPRERAPKAEGSSRPSPGASSGGRGRDALDDDIPF